MICIGPRPEAVPLSKSYKAGVPFYSFRHTVKPGITGWAAIHQGNVGGVDAASTKLRYDFFYVKNQLPFCRPLHHLEDRGDRTGWFWLEVAGSCIT
jgi:lipopolysaccharide/colanic/teichoic acid biosynthesis glycosyltransferase